MASMEDRSDQRLLQVFLPPEVMKALDHLRIDKEMTRKAFIEFLVLQELERERTQAVAS